MHRRRRRRQDTYFRLDGGGRITDTAYSLHTPSGYRCLNIFVLRTELLVQLVTECISRNGYSLRRNILQEMGNRLKLYGYVYDGYAAHISTLQNYYDRSMELLDTGVRGRLFCPERPVYGKENDSPSSYIDPEGGCVNSLVADGCDIQGSVKNCVLFRNVRIEKGASVEKLYSVQGYGGEKGRGAAGRYHGQVCDHQRKCDADGAREISHRDRQGRHGVRQGGTA